MFSKAIYVSLFVCALALQAHGTGDADVTGAAVSAANVASEQGDAGSAPSGAVVNAASVANRAADSSNTNAGDAGAEANGKKEHKKHKGGKKKHGKGKGHKKHPEEGAANAAPAGARAVRSIIYSEDGLVKRSGGFFSWIWA